MNIFKEVELYLTTFHPSLKLGDESLKLIKFTKSNTVKTKALANIVSNIPRDLSMTILPSGQTIEETPLTEQSLKAIDAKASNKTIPNPNDERPTIKVEGEERVLPTSTTYSMFDSVNFERPPISLKPEVKSLEQIINPEFKYTKVKNESCFNSSLPQKRLRNQDCPCCEWEFPNSFTQEECNRHVNLCIDGRGSEDIETYNKSVSAVKIAQDSDEETELEKLEEEIKLKCPYCNLRIGMRSKEFQERHVQECLQETQENTGINTGIQSEFGTIPKKTIDSMSKTFIQNSKRYY